MQPSEHEKLLDHARNIYIDRHQRGLPVNAEAIIAQMVCDLDEEAEIEAITKAVKEFLAP